MVSDSNWVQANFLGGEWSPYAQGRSDLPTYRTAMNVCRNGQPIEEGAWIRRSGTRFAATTLNGAYARVIPFAFEQNAPYVLELSNLAMRAFGVATQTGGLTTALPSDFRLVTTNDNQQVASVSTTKPAVVQTASAHGWSTGDQVEFLFASTVAPAFTPMLRNRVFQITVVDTTHFSITDPITSITVDGSQLGWSMPTAGTVVVARVMKQTTPYAAADLPLVRKVQAETSALFLHGSYQQQILNVATPPSSSAFATFTSLTPLSFLDGPYLDPPIDGSTLTPSGLSGSITLTASAITSINGGLGFQSTDVGRSVRVLSQPPAYNAGTAYTVGQSVTFNNAYFTCIQNGTGQQPDISIGFWTISTSAARWCWANITGVSSTSVVTVSVQPPTDNSSTGALLYTGSNCILTWRLGVFSGTTGWPTCGAYYEGRIWLAGSIPNRLDASMANALGTTYSTQKIRRVGGPSVPAIIATPTLAFSPTAPDGTVLDNSGISVTFNCEDTNSIFWILGTQTAIVCGTEAGEWTVQSSVLSDPITPSSIQAHRVTKYGCAKIEPEHTDLTVSFVHRYQRKVLEYFPDVFSGRYTAPNLSHNAKHLTTAFIQEIRYQRELTPTIWARNGDGSLIGATYKRTSLFSSQGPEFVGWHRHDLGSGRTVQSIAVGPSPDGIIDTLAMTTLDASGVYHVELMQPLFDVNEPITSGWFCDDAVVPSGAVITGNITLGGTITFYGLWHLNGKTVTVSCGGVDAGDAAVVNGAVTVPIDGDVGQTFTTAYLASISSQTAYGTLTVPVTAPLVGGGSTTYYVPAVIGFTYTSQGQCLRPDTLEQMRSQTGPGLGKPRRAHQFAALLAGTQGISFGTDFTRLHTANFKQLNGAPYAPTQLYNGVYWDTLDDTYSFDGMVCWQINRPYPGAVTALSQFQNAQDR